MVTFHLQARVCSFVLPFHVGFDLEDFQPAQSLSRIVGQAKDQDYRHSCGKSCELEASPRETMQRRGGVVWLKVKNA